MFRLILLSFFVAALGCSAAVDPNIALLGPDGGGTVDADLGTPPDAQQCNSADECQAPFSTGSCNNGSCSFVCDDNQGDCDGDATTGCETTLNTSQNCGGCGVDCGAGSCVNGGCTVQCPPNRADCDGDPANGCEVDLQTVQNCGACGRACQAGELCDASGEAPACSASCNETVCGMSCVDTNNDISNCGDCGRTCEFAGAAAVCNDGDCEIGECAPGFADCDGRDGNGCEADLSSPENCRGCDQQCSTEDNAISMCADTGCNYECNSGFADCNGDLGDNDDGCEVEIETDTDNCGQCGRQCQSENNADVMGCFASQCVLQCKSGFADCNSDLGNGGDGCEVEVEADPDNCGGCGVQCRPLDKSSAECKDSMCQRECDTDFADCDGDLDRPNSNGCESNLNSAQSCGSCNVQCNSPNTVSGCRDQQCQVDSCASNYCDIDGIGQNGCEVHLYDATSCQAPQAIGSVRGDRGGTVRAFGYGNASVVVEVREARNQEEHELAVSFQLQHAGNNTYQIQTFCDNCVSAGISGSNPAFTSLIWREQCPDATCSPDSSRDIVALIRQTSGNSCQPWELEVQGNTFFNGAPRCAAK